MIRVTIEVQGYPSELRIEEESVSTYALNPEARASEVAKLADEAVKRAQAALRA